MEASACRCQLRQAPIAILLPNVRGRRGKTGDPRKPSRPSDVSLGALDGTVTFALAVYREPGAWWCGYFDTSLNRHNSERRVSCTAMMSPSAVHPGTRLSPRLSVGITVIVRPSTIAGL